MALKWSRRQFSGLASKSDVRMTARAPPIGPLPDTAEVRTVTEYPRRARCFVIPATRRAATSVEGGESCVTNRTDRSPRDDTARP
jgi:hypothetical protein